MGNRVSKELTSYRRALALACLHRVPEGSDFAPTAAEIMEHMVALGQAEGHPKHCWVGLTSANVSGILRALRGEGKARELARRHNPRQGRLEPTWIVVDRNPKFPVPTPPDTESTERAPTEEEALYDSLSRTQLCELLRVHDKIAGASVRFMREIQDINEEARTRLARVGLAPE